MIKNFTLTCVCLMLLCSFTYGQRVITGTVTAETGETLPGVTVIVKNSTTGTATDINGQYSLRVEDASAVLVFSFVGYETFEAPVGARSSIDVTLDENIQSLNEVIVVAYGETEKRKFTGSVATIGSRELNQIPQTSPLQMMQGRAAGILVEDNSGAPGSVGSILIRGVGSYNEDAMDPLYVIDGIPTTNFGAFNPNDIESISVLKDASATSIYGSRAANGVVMITTKKGKSGKTQIGFSAQVGFSDIENPNDFRVLNATEYKDYYREAYTNAGLDPNALMPTNADSINTNWVDDVLRTGKTQQYEINMSGGSDKMSHYISANYYRQEGVVIGTDYERYTGRVNLRMSPTEKLHFDLNMLGAVSDSDLQFSDAGRSGILSGAYNVAPTASIYANEFTPQANNGLGFNFGLPSNAGHNPIASNAMNSRTLKEYRAFPTVKVTLEPIENLTLSSSASVDFEINKENAYQSKSYLAENDNGLAEAYTSYSTSSNFNAIAQYDLTLNDDHKITPLVGVERYKSSFEEEGAESREFGYDGIPLVGEGSVMLDILSGYTAHTLVSVFSKVNYAFKDKLFIDLSFRSDGSSRFGPDNRYGQFYGIGMGYDLSSENFFQSQSLFSQLRIRGSYGIQGNYDIGDYVWRKTYNSEGAFILPDGSNPGAQPEGPGNETIQWEESVSANFGVDFSALDNRLSGTLEYYSRGSDALLGIREISRTSGFSNFTDNLGDIRNRGVEISLSSVNVQSQDFTWSSNFNITFNKNEIKKLSVEGDTLPMETQAHIVGQPFGQWFLPQYAGVDPATGQPMYRSEDGSLTANENEALTTVSGQSALNPDFYGSLTNSFSYKGITLSAMLYFKSGFKVYNSLRQQLSVPGTNNIAASNLSRWQQPGDQTDVPIVDFNDQNSSQFLSTRWLEDGSFIRLRNVSLSYQIPSAVTGKWGLSDVVFSIRSVNLLTFTDYSGYDPNVGSFDTDDDYPINRTITFGISAKF